MADIPAHWIRAENFVYAAVLSGELEIDDLGQIWRVACRRGKRGGGSHLVPCERRRAEHDIGDYYQVRVMINGKRYHALAHRLVWRHFKGEIPEGLTINHENGQKKHNPPSNLELATGSEQMIHAHATGLIDQSGEKNHQAKLSDAEVEDIRITYSKGGHTMEDLSRMRSVTFQTISKIVRGDRRAKQPGPLALRGVEYKEFPNG